MHLALMRRPDPQRNDNPCIYNDTMTTPFDTDNLIPRIRSGSASGTCILMVAKQQQRRRYCEREIKSSGILLLARYGIVTVFFQSFIRTSRRSCNRAHCCWTKLRTRMKGGMSDRSSSRHRRRRRRRRQLDYV
jgi:hypothetical protein